jgi:putative SOS response-associated peptidase YedK
LFDFTISITKIMCGRFSFVADKEKVKKTLKKVKIETDLQTSYNIAPTQQAYIVTNREPETLQLAHWGLVPSWSKDGQPNGALINARMETILEKPSFRDAFQSQRCLVPADSFYEWRNSGGRKQPFRITDTEGGLLVFAGIHSMWKTMLKTFSIITTEPNAEMAQIHTRMPVILKTEAEQNAWLANDTPIDTLIYMCRKPTDGLLQMYRVSEKINSVKYNGTDLHREVPEDLTLF